MKNFSILLAVIFFISGSAFGGADADGFWGANQLRLSKNVTLYHANEKNIPSFVEGKLSDAIPVGQEIEASLSFFEKHKAAYKMNNPTEELHPLRIDEDDLGMRHVRFQQYYQGVKVIGGDIITHFDRQGILKTVNGNFIPEITLDVTPRLSAADATALAQDDLAGFFGKGNPGPAELAVFPWEGKTYLCWRMFLYSDTPMGRWEYFVDAHAGEIIYKANRIMNSDAIGTGIGVMGGARNHIDTDYNGSNYRMIDYTRQLNNNPHGHDGQMPDGNYLQTNVAGSTLPGSVATDADNVWDDPNTQSPAVDGHVYSALVYDWWLSEFNRNGYDNAGASMLTIVNYSGDGDNNAYWDGSRIVIWSWSSGWRSLAGCPDVIAHEWGHAVTEYCSNLIYEKEPGALNESFSDMMGAAFEFAHDTMDTPDWLMGENGQISGEGFRSMSDPHLFGDPDYYGTSDPYWVDVENCTPSWLNDYCGVHTNSGVGNKWFYLLSDGGTHYGVTVNGIGVANAIKIAYRANAYYWTSTTDYYNAALGTMSASDDLDTTATWTAQVANAWNAVGVSVPLPSVAFSYPNGVPSVLTPDVPTTFEVVVSGSMGGTPVPGTGQLHYSLDGGAYVTVAMNQTSDNNYEATLPAASCGSSYLFYVSAEEQSTGRFYDPDTANPFDAVVASNTVTVFADDFETDQGWSVSGDAVTGQWERGVPVGGGDRGDPATDFDGSGSCYLTENVDGDSDVDGGTTSLTSPAFDLSTGDARIHYARWYSNNFGGDPNNDIFQVFISNDNGSSWTLVETVGPVEQASGGWYENTFWVSDYVTPTAQVRLRFDASDLNNGSVVEAAVDDVTVTRYECGASPPQIITTSLPDWTQGSPYSQQLEATGGSGALTWSDKYNDLAGSGLSLSSSGLLSGTPTTTGLVSFTAEVIDEASQSDTKLFSFTINPQLSITTDSLPDWTDGFAYSQQLQSLGGTGVKTWQDKNNDLVGTGLFLSTTGIISGTPSTTGTISFTAVVTDVTSQTAEKLFEFTINPALSITTDSLPTWTVGVAYSNQLTATGGTGSHTWSDKNNDLAGTGLSLSAAGLVSGTPTSAGTVNFTAMVSDDVGASGEKPFSFTINPAVSITTAALPDGMAGQPYSLQLEATGGTGTLTWTDKNGDLTGTGLSLGSDGMFNGTPTDSGTISFTARAEDGVGSFDEKTYSFFVEPAYLCGDVNGDNDVNVADLTYLVDFLFGGGDPPPVEEAADVDGSGTLNVADVTTLVGYLFQSGELNCQ